ncbi:unnamed protein product [Urochloa humidicola]
MAVSDPAGAWSKRWRETLRDSKCFLGPIIVASMGGIGTATGARAHFIDYGSQSMETGEPCTTDRGRGQIFSRPFPLAGIAYFLDSLEVFTF